MFEYALTMIPSKRKHWILFTLFFLFVYTLIDSFNMSYSAMASEYSVTLVVVNILLNILMSILSGLLMTLSTVMATIYGHEGKGQNMGFLSIVFGILTYGCTPCVIAFFASIGISFSVVALPLAGLPYKLVSLVLIILGLVFIRYEMKKPCPIRKEEVPN